jgi:hypothetical protein
MYGRRAPRRLSRCQSCKRKSSRGRSSNGDWRFDHAVAPGQHRIFDRASQRVDRFLMLGYAFPLGNRSAPVTNRGRSSRIGQPTYQDVGIWHKCEVPSGSGNVCYLRVDRTYGGHHETDAIEPVADMRIKCCPWSSALDRWNLRGSHRSAGPGLSLETHMARLRLRRY